MSIILGICIGIGLSAACGFRVFLPFLIMNIAVSSGHLTLSENFKWVGEDIAFYIFLAATIFEIAGYYIPWVDNLLDTVATPAAIIAGIIISGSVMTDMDPMMKWTLAIIAGGGTSAAVQAGTVTGRTISTATTGGIGNPLVATTELVGSVLMSVLAIILPLAGGIFAIILLIYGINKIFFTKNEKDLNNLKTIKIETD